MLFVQSDLSRMLDLSNWELLGLAVDLFVVHLLNRLYKNQVKDADLIMVSQLSLSSDCQPVSQSKHIY